MMTSTKIFVFLCVMLTATSVFAQKEPNLDNGYKAYGSYDGSNIDTINLQNGNLMLHIPMPFSYPQRGSLTSTNVLTVSSKAWSIEKSSGPDGELFQQWTVDAFTPASNIGKIGTGVGFANTMDLAVHRTLNHEINAFGSSINTTSYYLTTWDGSTHQLIEQPNGPRDANNDPLLFDAADASGYRLERNVNCDSHDCGVVIDRAGNRYEFSGYFSLCGPWTTENSGAGSPQTQVCQQASVIERIIDSNGNRIDSLDTMGRLRSGSTAVPGGDTSGCVAPDPSIPIASAITSTYQGYNGVTNQMKVCYANVPLQTSFAQSGITEYGATAKATLSMIVTVLFLDGDTWTNSSRWTFAYDSYGNVTKLGLPAGGTITYGWSTLNLSPDCSDTQRTRVVSSRIVDDNNGHSFRWTYGYGVPTLGGVFVSTVTDPLNNDTLHYFYAQDKACAYYEQTTQYFQGSSASANGGLPAKQIDTTYTRANAFLPNQGLFTPTYVPTVIKTTMGNGKVSQVTKSYDSGPGNGRPMYGNVIQEMSYDWGAGGPGPLMQEVDTNFKWQADATYEAAHLLDIATSSIVKDPSGCAVAETDYAYDEGGEGALQFSGIGASQQYIGPYTPGIRGNQTSMKKWLITGASSGVCGTKSSNITSTAKFYDTGLLYQAIDPLNHASTRFFDAAYAGAYATKTCDALGHCVSGTYDFNTGLLTSFTNQNGTMAVGNTPGDAAHTTRYDYDAFSRIKVANLPDGGQVSFNYSAPNTFPLSAEKVKKINATLSDHSFAYVDGLGRPFRSVHRTPDGDVTVLTTYDGLDHAISVTNPYISTSDPTYGIIQTQYDALGRVKQTTKQDGSLITTVYNQNANATSGDCSTTTDEAGKLRKVCSDALGRVIEVDEPNPGTGPFNGHDYVTLQTDGNFVLYDATRAAQWSTNTAGSNASFIRMQDDGNLVLYHEVWERGTYRAPSGATAPYDACRIGDTLTAGQTLRDGQCLESKSGMTFVVMTNGDLQMYDRQLGKLTSLSNTYGNAGAYATMQSDGNFVIYSSANRALWASNTAGSGATLLELENDGRLILYNPVWSSGTARSAVTGTMTHPACDVGSGTGLSGVLGTGSCFVSANGRFDLAMQTDGNLVLYDRATNPATAIWSSGTKLSPMDPGAAFQTLYTYDTLGNLTCAVQKGVDSAAFTTCAAAPPSWRPRSFTYDSLSRLLTASNPESGTTTYSYDAVGNMLQKTSPAANQTGSATTTISVCYDALNRPTAKAYSAQSCANGQLPTGTAVVTYTYDSGTNGIGKPTSLTDQAGSASYNYDALGRLASEQRTTNNVSKSVSYDYNLDSSVRVVHYPSGTAITYAPDAAGRTVSAADLANGINYVTGATYAPDNSIKGFISGNTTAFAGITNAFTYNLRLQPVNISATTPSQQKVFSIGYDFHLGNGTTGSDNGNVFGITNFKDTDRSESFTYDALNRLASAQTQGTNCATTLADGHTKNWGNSYSYDPWGNLLAKTPTKCGADNIAGTMNTKNQPSSYLFNGSSAVNYTFDAAGNLRNDGVLTYNYDAENRITGANNFTYTYDADGNRVKKSNGTIGTLYWYASIGVITETDLSGNNAKEYVFFNGTRVARKDPNGQVFYYFSDHLKTTAVVTDSAGSIKSESDFDPWGVERRVVNTLDNTSKNNYKFTGKERDDETGFDYFGARYYSSNLGRFVTPDWSAKAVAVPYADFGNPQSLNLYSYVKNNPTTLVDIDGHEDKDNKQKQKVKPHQSGPKKTEQKKERPVVNVGTGMNQVWQPRQDPGPSGNSNQGGSNQGGSNQGGSNQADPTLPNIIDPKTGNDQNGVCHVEPPKDSVRAGRATEVRCDGYGCYKVYKDTGEALPHQNRMPNGMPLEFLGDGWATLAWQRFQETHEHQHIPEEQPGVPLPENWRDFRPGLAPGEWWKTPQR